VEAEEGSITLHVQGVKSGSTPDFEAIWSQYFGRLAALAGRNLSPIGKQFATPDEVAGSVLRILWEGARKDKFAPLNDRQDLWRLLVLLTEHKVIDKERQARAKKRGGAPGVGRAPSDLLAQVPSKEPSPALVHELQDEMDRLLRLLPTATLQQIALWRLENRSVEEIAILLDVTTRTIERKLVLIRDLWADQFGRAGRE
jgi:DNA-directed RNA polymerase specialized sigma24 family protein